MTVILSKSLDTLWTLCRCFILIILWVLQITVGRCYLSHLVFSSFFNHLRFRSGTRCTHTTRYRFCGQRCEILGDQDLALSLQDSDIVQFIGFFVWLLERSFDFLFRLGAKYLIFLYQER